MNKRRQRLTVERLEDRNLMATFGVAWPGADHLKVSFVPDGTAVDNSTSVLFQSLNGQAATKVWETEVLRALQTWAVYANINLGVVADGGQALGVAGPAQGNPNFGDIRVAARPLGADVLALTTPYDVVAGTRAGDVVFNSAAGLGLGAGAKYDLFSLALHEAGHALGLDNNLDPTSVMYQYYTGVRTGLSASDVAMIQALYGARTPDYYEGAAGNNSLATATPLKLPEVAADVGTGGDVDFYKYTVPSYANRTVTFTVQTAGLSLLTPTLTVYNASGQVLATASATDPLNNNVSFTLTGVKRGTVLYVAVQGARSDVFGVGGYRLKIDSGDVSQKQIKLIDAALNSAVYNFASVDTHDNGTLAKAVSLNQLVYQLNQAYDYSLTATLTGTSDLDYYKLVAPAATASGPQTMIATVTRTGKSTLDPELTAYDASGNEVNAEILANDGNSYTVQVVGATPGATYYLCVSTNDFETNPANLKGDYVLGINFQSTPIVLETYVDDSLSVSDQVDTFSLQSTQSQVVELVLSATTGDTGSTVPTAVRLNIYDATGAVVASLTCQDGDTVSQNVFLAQGNYVMRFVAATQDGSALPQVSYTLQGRVISGPQDPLPIDPTLDPTQTTAPSDTVIVSSPTTPPTLPPLDPGSNPWSPPPTVLGG
jgi:hypothetical protein